MKLPVWIRRNIDPGWGLGCLLAAAVFLFQAITGLQPPAPPHSRAHITQLESLVMATVLAVLGILLLIANHIAKTDEPGS